MPTFIPLGPHSFRTVPLAWLPKKASVW